MKITHIEVIPLVRKLEDTFEGGTYRIVNRNTHEVVQQIPDEYVLRLAEESRGK